MGRPRLGFVTGYSLITIGILSIALLASSQNLDVDYEQRFTLLKPDLFRAGTGDAGNGSALEEFFRLSWNESLPKTVGEFDLDAGLHSVWIERLDGAGDVGDVVSLYLERDGRFVSFVNPHHQRVVVRNGVEYERLFIINADGPGTYEIRARLLNESHDREDVRLIVADESWLDEAGAILGLVATVCGAVVLIVSFSRLRGAPRHAGPSASAAPVASSPPSEADGRHPDGDAREHHRDDDQPRGA